VLLASCITAPLIQLAAPCTPAANALLAAVAALAVSCPTAAQEVAGISPIPSAAVSSTAIPFSYLFFFNSLYSPLIEVVQKVVF
jgi:hypothetical protein